MQRSNPSATAHVARTVRAACLGLSAGSALVCAASNAGADSGASPSVSWQAPPECPDGRALSSRLELVLGAELSQYARDWQVQGRVSSESGAWQLVLELREPGATPESARAQRLLRATRCEDLVEAAALAIAIAIGDAREARAVGAATSSSAGAASASSALPSAQPADAAAPAAASSGPTPRRSLALSLEAVLDSASVSGAALGGSAAIGAWLGDFGVDLHGVWLQHEKSLGNDQNVDFALLTAGARACYRMWGSVASWGLAPCLGFELGRFSADSHGLRAASSTHDTWLAPSLGVDFMGRVLGPLAARSRLELLLPLQRQAYEVDLVQPVHEIPALTVRWSVGVDADLPLP